MSTIVFLGGGRITSALLAGSRLRKSRHRFLVYDRHPAKLRALHKAYDAAIERDLDRAVTQADLLIIAVRPDSARALLLDISNIDRPLLALSLVAGFSLRQLKSIVGPPVRWARAMPSPVCRTGCGLTALAFSRGISPRDRILIQDFFATTGDVIQVSESKLNAFTVTYSPSHGYHALAALAAAGQRAGLDRKTALLASAHALSDAVAAWRKGSHSLASLLHEAATPGGIAATAMAAMDAAGYSHAVHKGIQAGLRRARANARR